MTNEDKKVSLQNFRLITGFIAAMGLAQIIGKDFLFGTAFLGIALTMIVLYWREKKKLHL
jgi:Flp pilus assembly protein protease CpaA